MSDDNQATGPRARNRAAVESRLRTVGHRHLAEHGAAGLSLRAVARDMEITPSALYRYVRDRDALLTLLIVDAYTDLADSIDAAVARHRSGRTRFTAFAGALRDWALANPSEYALLYGSPVPGYRAPREQTNPAGERPLIALASILTDAGSAPDVAGTDPRVQSAAARALGLLSDDPAVPAGADAAVLARGIAVWNLLLGSITSELFEQLGPVTDDPATLYAGVVDLGAALLFG
ncbi:TetR/AcrR family transcriptional regulator [Gordonia neofelifaecis]|uniref:Tetr family transcriptional regulator n=1 Tax=Gordonia neofelifaecis NRRL B-59395 TaxID=644548 RepID=F1YEP8_9ACTN|nr:TetR-like C-terminal domain-containing protein [Gordonia neofelifaecis]EGD56881.1 tetr family transcriptional regulator [Gordonia neofelifaecis NRRL B-59395]